MSTTTIDYSKMTPAQMLAAIQQLQEANTRLTAQRTAKISWRVSQRGAISIYGLGRFPTTLHPSQLEALLALKEELLKFVAEQRATCEAQSDLWLTTETEGKARGLEDTKLEAWVKEQLLAAKNPFVVPAKETH